MVFAAIKRQLFKQALIVRIHERHGINVKALGQLIGPGTLDDLLNVQFELASGMPDLGAQNVERELMERFGIDLGSIASQALGASNDETELGDFASYLSKVNAEYGKLTGYDIVKIAKISSEEDALLEEFCRAAIAKGLSPKKCALAINDEGYNDARVLDEKY